MSGYTGRYKGVTVSVQGSGMGMPSMGIYSYELFNMHGVENIIRIGTAGSFNKNIGLGDVIVALAASTDSNYQHTYGINGNYAPCASYELLKKIQAASLAENISIHCGSVVSCDVFYEDDPDWWKGWAKLNVMAVEMETAALYMNAARCNKNAIAVMTISDNFVTGAKSTVEERQTAFTDMMRLALSAGIS